MNKQIKVTITEETLSLLKKEAALRCVTPAALAKIRLNEIFLSKAEIDICEKAYVVQLKNWREVEGYARLKGSKTVEQLAVDAIGAEMRRHSLTAAQKAELERIIEK